MPLSIVGIIIASKKLVEILKINTKISLFFSYLFIYFLFKYEVFVELGGYKGIVHFFASLFFFVAFYILPLENINSCLKKIIKHITSYTNGIYCMQRDMIPFVRRNFHLIGTLKSCIIIYLLSYFISFLGNKILGKTRLKYLFI